MLRGNEQMIGCTCLEEMGMRGVRRRLRRWHIVFVDIRECTAE